MKGAFKATSCQVGPKSANSTAAGESDTEKCYGQSQDHKVVVVQM